MDLDKFRHQRIYLSQLAFLLGWDRRTLNKWVYKKCITIYSDTANGRKYISSVQFEYAWNEFVMHDLQKRYGERWCDAFEAYQNVNVMLLIALQDAGKNKMRLSNYAPTEHEKKVLSRLTGKSFEL